MRLVLLRLLGIGFTVLSIGNTIAQKNRYLYTNIFYKSDKYVLEPNEKEKLIRMLDTLDFDRIKRIELRAHTDNSADSIYNIKLSEKRARSVVECILGEGISKELIFYHYFGENSPVSNNETDQGKQKNRRVELRLTYFYPPPQPKQDISITKNQITEPCKLLPDTIVELKTGFMARMNHCNLEIFKNCLRVEYISNPQELHNSNLRMIDNQGQHLASKGMVTFITKNDSCKRYLDSFKAELLFSVQGIMDDNYICGDFMFYIYDSKRKKWRLANDGVQPMVEYNGIVFRSMTINASSLNRTLNCDAPISGMKIKKFFPYVKVKIPKDYKFVARSCMACGGFTLLEYNETERMDRKHIWKIKRSDLNPGTHLLIKKKNSKDTLIVVFSEFDSTNKILYKNRATTNVYEKDNPIRYKNSSGKIVEKKSNWPLIFTALIPDATRKYYLTSKKISQFR